MKGCPRIKMGEKITCDMHDFLENSPSFWKYRVRLVKKFPAIRSLGKTRNYPDWWPCNNDLRISRSLSAGPGSIDLTPEMLTLSCYRHSVYSCWMYGRCVIITLFRKTSHAATYIYLRFRIDCCYPGIVIKARQEETVSFNLSGPSKPGHCTLII